MTTNPTTEETTMRVSPSRDGVTPADRTPEPARATVCVTHGRFMPCRDGSEHVTSTSPYWVKSVRDFQGSDDPNLPWEPVDVATTDRAAIRDSDEPSERGDFPYYDLGPATSETVAALDLDAITVRAARASEHIGTSSFAYPCVSVDVPALVAEVRSLRANWRMVTTALGYGDGITEPQIEHRDFVAECERQFAEASEWRESQRWRDECHEAGHPDDEDCYEHDPVLALVALRAKVAAVEARVVEWEALRDRLRAQNPVRKTGSSGLHRREANTLDVVAEQIRAALATGEGK